MKRVGSSHGGLAGIPGRGGAGGHAGDLAGSLPAQPMLSEQRTGREPRWARPDAAQARLRGMEDGAGPRGSGGLGVQISQERKY